MNLSGKDRVFVSHFDKTKKGGGVQDCREETIVSGDKCEHSLVFECFKQPGVQRAHHRSKCALPDLHLDARSPHLSPLHIVDSIELIKIQKADDKNLPHFLQSPSPAPIKLKQDTTQDQIQDDDEEPVSPLRTVDSVELTKLRRIGKAKPDIPHFLQSPAPNKQTQQTDESPPAQFHGRRVHPVDSILLTRERLQHWDKSYTAPAITEIQLRAPSPAKSPGKDRGSRVSFSPTDKPPSAETGASASKTTPPVREDSTAKVTGRRFVDAGSVLPLGDAFLMDWEGRMITDDRGRIRAAVDVSGAPLRLCTDAVLADQTGQILLDAKQRPLPFSRLTRRHGFIIDSSGAPVLTNKSSPLRVTDSLGVYGLISDDRALVLDNKHRPTLAVDKQRNIFTVKPPDIETLADLTQSTEKLESSKTNVKPGMGASHRSSLGLAELSTAHSAATFESANFPLLASSERVKVSPGGVRLDQSLVPRPFKSKAEPRVSSSLSLAPDGVVSDRSVGGGLPRSGVFLARQERVPIKMPDGAWRPATDEKGEPLRFCWRPMDEEGKCVVDGSRDTDTNGVFCLVSDAGEIYLDEEQRPLMAIDKHRRIITPAMLGREKILVNDNKAILQRTFTTDGLPLATEERTSTTADGVATIRRSLVFGEGRRGDGAVGFKPHVVSSASDHSHQSMMDDRSSLDSSNRSRTGSSSSGPITIDLNINVDSPEKTPVNIFINNNKLWPHNVSKRPY